MRIYGALPAVLASEVGHTRKTFDEFFVGRCFSVKMSRIIARFRELLIPLSSFVVTTRISAVMLQTWDGIRWLPLDGC